MFSELAGSDRDPGMISRRSLNLAIRTREAAESNRHDHRPNPPNHAKGRHFGVKKQQKDATRYARNPGLQPRESASRHQIEQPYIIEPLVAPSKTS